MPNANLNKAKAAKNDEFYTVIADIEREMNAYFDRDPDVFRGKTILCPCDDPTWSNFTKHFTQNFVRYGLKKLICTGYHKGARGMKYVLEGDTDGNGKVEDADIVATEMEGDGDFRSEEVQELLEEVDFIITNPPFSLFREFIAWIMEHGKKFAIIGFFKNVLVLPVRMSWSHLYSGLLPVLYYLHVHHAKEEDFHGGTAQIL